MTSLKTQQPLKEGLTRKMGASLKKDEREKERAELVDEAERERERAQKEFEMQKAAERVKYEEILSAVERGEESAKTKVAWYKLSWFGGAQEKDGEAMWMLGLCKEYERGIERDIEGAEKLYKESKEAGNEIGEILVKKGGWERGSGKMKIRSL